jgi:hypothetical protein
VDYNPYTDLTADNWYAHLLMGMSGGMVRTTMVAGRLLMQNRDLLTVDAERVYRQARLQARGVWERI